MANTGHNVAGLKKVIRDCAHQMTEIKVERKGLNERASDIRERLRKAGVQTKAFDFAVRLQEMEHEARDDYLDSLRINFDALGVGAQSEMFQEAAGVAGNGTGKPKPISKKATAKASGKGNSKAKGGAKSKATTTAKPVSKAEGASA